MTEFDVLPIDPVERNRVRNRNYYRLRKVLENHFIDKDFQRALGELEKEQEMMSKARFASQYARENLKPGERVELEISKL